MSRIREITVSLNLTVQPKQYQSMGMVVSVTKQYDETEELEGGTIGSAAQELRKSVSLALSSGLREEVEKVYGKATADYVVNQKG